MINNYHQKLEAEEKEEEDDEEDPNKLLEQIVRKRTLSAQSNGDEKKEMNEKDKINEVKQGKG